MHTRISVNGRTSDDLPLPERVQCIIPLLSRRTFLATKVLFVCNWVAKAENRASIAIVHPKGAMDFGLQVSILRSLIHPITPHETFSRLATWQSI